MFLSIGLHLDASGDDDNYTIVAENINEKSIDAVATRLFYSCSSLAAPADCSAPISIDRLSGRRRRQGEIII